MKAYTFKKGLFPFNSYRNLYCAFLFLIITVLAAPLSAEIVAVDQIGGLRSPARVVLTASGTIYVTDNKQGKVFIFDSSGRKVGTLESFTAPLGLAVLETPTSVECQKFKESNGKCKDQVVLKGRTFVFVGDEGNGSVKVFIDGEYSRALGNGEGEFGKPNGIAVTAGLFSYVVDSQSNQVKLYDGLGNLQKAFGNTLLNFPTDVVLNEAAGEVYVADFYNKRIVVFNLEGLWLRNINPPANDMGDPVFFRPSGLGIDPAGKLYVVDNALSCVAIIDSQGLILDTIGYHDGQYWTGELSVPVDAASDGRKIYVTSNRQHQVKVFGVVP